MTEPIRFLGVDEVLRIHERDGCGVRRHAGRFATTVCCSRPFICRRHNAAGSTSIKVVSEMAAAYLYHICSNHPFADGDKRTALASAETVHPDEWFSPRCNECGTGDAHDVRRRRDNVKGGCDHILQTARLPSNPDMPRSLDQKLAAIHADPSGCREFILADAKDADMAFGMVAPGVARTDSGQRLKTLAEYREQIRAVVRQGIVDIMLMSASTSEQLTLGERLFDRSPVTPAIRANDATDVHSNAGECDSHAAGPALADRLARPRAVRTHRLRTRRT